MNRKSITLAAVVAIGLVGIHVWNASGQAKPAKATSGEVVFKRQSGDLAAFFLQQATACGAHQKTNGVISKVETTWEFAEDPDGFQILMAPADTERLVQAAMVPAFGEPMRRTSFPHIYYYIKDIGIALSIGTNNIRSMGTTNHHLICARGETMRKQLGAKP